MTLFGQARARQTQTTLVSRVFKLISTRFMTPDGFISAERGVQQQGCIAFTDCDSESFRQEHVDRLRKTIALAAPTPAPKKPSERKVAFEEVGSLFLIGILFSCRPRCSLIGCFGGSAFHHTGIHTKSGVEVVKGESSSETWRKPWERDCPRKI